MDNLTNIKIDANTLTFTLDTEQELEDCTMVLYVDEVWNLKNILNDCPAHNYKFTVTNSRTYDNQYSVTDDKIVTFDWNMKYLTLVCTKDHTEYRYFGLYYEPKLVYQAELRKLHSYCQTCLDDRTMQDIMLVVFKRQLLEYAIKGEHYKDAMQLYVDICRLLDISIEESYQHSVNCCTDCILGEGGKCQCTECVKPTCHSCKTCAGGMCKLN